MVWKTAQKPYPCDGNNRGQKANGCPGEILAGERYLNVYYVSAGDHWGHHCQPCAFEFFADRLSLVGGY
jgi:hypothetical protein